MSDYRAIASVTATLRSMLQDLADVVVPGTRVEAGPPIGQPETRSEPVVRIFLYAVSPHPTLRNIAQPVRRADGSIARTPTLPLELRYLISFIGDDPQLKAQLLLGAVMTFLETQPMPMPHDVDSGERAIGQRAGDAPGALSPGEVDSAQFVLEPLDHDALARLWSVFAHVPYALSVAYRCSLLLLRPTFDPQPVLPIAEPRLRPNLSPKARALVPEAAEARAGLGIAVRGVGIGRLIDPAAWFGTVAASVSVIDADTLRVVVPDELPAGNHAVTIAAAGQLASAPLFFQLLPRVGDKVTFDPQRSTLSVPIAPDLRPGQVAFVLLNPIGVGEGQAFAFSVAADRIDRPSAVLQASLSRPSPGRYLVRVDVNHAISRLQRGDGAEGYNGPLLVID